MCRAVERARQKKEKKKKTTEVLIAGRDVYWGFFIFVSWSEAKAMRVTGWGGIKI